MQHSGWAMGGRDMFAQKLCDIVRGLGEDRLATVIMDKIGFKRNIPIDEDDIPPLVPMDIQPGQQVPAYEQDEPAPKDAEDVESCDNASHCQGRMDGGLLLLRVLCGLVAS